MKRWALLLLPMALFISAQVKPKLDDDEDLHQIQFSLGLGMTDLINPFQPTTTEIDLSLGLELRLTSRSSIQLGYDFPTVYTNDDSSITYYGWDLELSQLNLLWRYKPGSGRFTTIAGVGAAWSQESYRGAPQYDWENFGGLIHNGRVDIEDTGAVGVMGLEYGILRTLSLQGLVQQHLTDTAADPNFFSGLQNGEGKPTRVALRLQWRPAVRRHRT